MTSLLRIVLAILLFAYAARAMEEHLTAYEVVSTDGEDYFFATHDGFRSDVCPSTSSFFNPNEPYVTDPHVVQTTFAESYATHVNIQSTPCFDDVTFNNADDEHYFQTSSTKAEAYCAQFMNRPYQFLSLTSQEYEQFARLSHEMKQHLWLTMQRVDQMECLLQFAEQREKIEFSLTKEWSQPMQTISTYDPSLHGHPVYEQYE